MPRRDVSAICVGTLAPPGKKPELTAEEVELLTSPMELTDYKDAIMEAMYRGTKRNIESEPEGKNTAAG